MSQDLETATFAGGCFWCTEAVFQRLKGVVSVTSGYAGGGKGNPTYEEVSTGETGFAEAVQIMFDPKIISFSQLLEIFWATHDPSTLNQQGSDVGTQYRSMIFYHDENQKQQALDSKDQLKKEGTFQKIVTEIVPYTNFYTAEQYHQNFYNSQPNYPYCSIVISPKIKKLLKKFGGMVKEEYKSSQK